ncbi:MAG TPA: OmpA family protein [Elusimicrobiales bacterium]|nr:OmpA family protein [Elusimicrobiales bacterium]
MKSFLRRYTTKTEESPLYLVVLADIMTNLMLFFLILYVFNIQGETTVKAAFADGFDKKHAQEQKEKKALDVIQKYEEADVAKKLKEEMGKSGMEDMAEVQMTEKQIRINIAAPVLFASGKAALGAASEEILGAVARVIGRLPNDIIVEGHTDSVPVRSGDYNTNWELSAARADAVVELLAGKYGIPQERMVAAAYGEYRPVATNATAEGRARNRRIEIIMSRK